MPRVEQRALTGPKRQRVTRACDLCHKKGNKCSPSEREGLCEPCRMASVECTYNRPVKRRGPAPGTTVPRARSPTQHSPKSPILHQNGHDTWQPVEIATHEAIIALVACYHDIVFPIFCFFHWPTFLSLVKNKAYLSDRALYATVMTVCAISSARLRDGATLSLASVPQSITAQSEDFYREAEAAIPVRLTDAKSFEYIRAVALLAITALQYGELRLMQNYLGNFHTLIAIDGRHDEKQWEGHATRIQVEERRRLFWSIYTLEVYTAVVWGGVVRCRESQSLIQYPLAVDDEYLTEETVDTTVQPPDEESWLVGWNFTTDLYRLLEHALDHTRSQRSFDTKMSAVLNVVKGGPPPSSAVLELVTSLYDQLPRRFKEVRSVSFKAREDRFSFQSANIIVTMQTVRMVVLGREESLSVEKRCEVARQLLEAIRVVPTAYLQSISSPLLHHLAGIGNLLGEVIQGPLSQNTFYQVRDVLLLMADLLASLESKLRFAAGGSARLKAHVQRIDAFMTAATSRKIPSNPPSETTSITSARNSRNSRDWPDQDTERDSVLRSPVVVGSNVKSEYRSVIDLSRDDGPLHQRMGASRQQHGSHATNIGSRPSDAISPESIRRDSQSHHYAPPYAPPRPEASPTIGSTAHAHSPRTLSNSDASHHEFGMRAVNNRHDMTSPTTTSRHHIPPVRGPTDPPQSATGDVHYTQAHTTGPSPASLVPESPQYPAPPAPPSAPQLPAPRSLLANASNAVPEPPQFRLGDPRSWQFRLPQELLAEWPFDLGQGLIFPDSLSAPWQNEGYYDKPPGVETGLGWQTSMEAMSRRSDE